MKTPASARLRENLLFYLCLALCALLAIFAVVLQTDRSLFSGFLEIQLSPAALITDPISIGGVGAALLNAALLLLLSLLLVRVQKMPFTALTVACLFMMAGFALLGKNILNSLPILLGGFLYARYKGEPFSRYTYISLFSTCLSPMTSHFLNAFDAPLGVICMVICGVVTGFLTPAISAYTVRIHQGYNLYNVGFAAGFVALAMVSVLRGFGLEFIGTGTWSVEYNRPLSILALCIILLLFLLGVWQGCRSWRDYRHLLSHSGRVVADFFALEGYGATFVNMALTGAIGFAYLKIVGAPMNGPLLCCLFAMMGFGCFGKHPRNVLPTMAGAVLAALCMPALSIQAPGVLLATLLCTGLAPIAGQFGALWGAAAGFVHMSIVQNTSYLYAGLNLYNNGFAAGLSCVVMIPLIEALKSEPEE